MNERPEESGRRKMAWDVSVPLRTQGFTLEQGQCEGQVEVVPWK